MSVNATLEKTSQMCHHSTFGSERRHWAVFDKLAPIAQELVAAPTWQAYVVKIFYASGFLSSGKMNRMGKSTGMRTLMKVNAGPLRDTGFL